VKFAIFGSGFGLYGYLPAVMDGCKQSICLPERYRSRLESRDDVRQFRDAVTWTADERAALAEVDAVVISQRPADQANWIRDCASRSNIRALLLEKPLAPSPEAASDALDLLETSGKKFRIGYTFRFTGWASLLKQHCLSAATRSISIDWQFRAHHYVHDISNWKRFVSEGGGALRFFGIHLVAMLAEFGYEDVTQCRTAASLPNECETWSAVFVGPGLPECRVHVNSRAATPLFSIDRNSDTAARERLVDLSDPFAMDAPVRGFDRRVGLLTVLCMDLIECPPLSYPWYRQSVKLWDRTECHR
jgi:predicted dehydrogenase